MFFVAPAKQKIGGLAKQLLLAANIEPALVKAIIKSPPEIHGGPKTRRFPWPIRRHYDRRERDAVLRLLNLEIRRGGAIVYNGPEKAAYCAEFARYLGGGNIETVNSGTNAVYVALRGLDLEPGSEVIVPPISDAGGTMPVVMANCIPVPADSDSGSLNTSAEQIAKVLSPSTAAIILAHISGHPVDMDPILALAAERGIPVLEDCAQAHGAEYKGRKVGTLGTVAAFSTMFGKHHSTGAQGGAVFTKDTLVFARVRQITDRGKPFGASTAGGNLIASLNFNQDELSLAIGRVQLLKLPKALEARRDFVARVADGLRGLDVVELVEPTTQSRSAYWFVLLRLKLEKLSCGAQEFGRALELEGIGGVSGGYPFFPTDQPWHRDAAVFGASGIPWSLVQQKPRAFELPNAHAANARMVRIDVHERLGRNEAAAVVTAVRKVASFYAVA